MIYTANSWVMSPVAYGPDRIVGLCLGIGYFSGHLVSITSIDCCFD